jgi:hypothetical protein
MYDGGDINPPFLFDDSRHPSLKKFPPPHRKAPNFYTAMVAAFALTSSMSPTM